MTNSDDEEENFTNDEVVLDAEQQFWSNMVNGMRDSAMIRASRGRTAAGKCTLRMEDVVAMYKSQDGRCFYSGIPMTLKSSACWKASPERLDNDKGYVDGNVVLICLEFNGFHQMSYARIQQMIESSQKVFVSRATYNDLKQFWEQYQITYGTTYTLEQFYNQFMKQNGRCHYSGVPLMLDWDNGYDRPFIVEKGNGRFYLIINALWISPNCLWSERKFSKLRYNFLTFLKPEDKKIERRKSI